MLFLVLHHRQVDEDENGEEERAEYPLVRRDGEAGGDNQRAEIERVPRVRVRSACGESAVLF